MVLSVYCEWLIGCVTTGLEMVVVLNYEGIINAGVANIAHFDH